MDDQTTPPPATTSGDAEPAEGAYAELQDTEWRDPSLPSTFPSGATVEADRRDAVADHVADPSGANSSADADAAPDRVAPSVAAAERAANERGANVRGEGQITGPPAPLTMDSIRDAVASLTSPWTIDQLAAALGCTTGDARGFVERLVDGGTIEDLGADPRSGDGGDGTHLFGAVTR